MRFRIPMWWPCSIKWKSHPHPVLWQWAYLRLAHTKVSARTALFPPSPEQQVAVETLLHSKDNIIIDACAGSGKTTTILHLAQAAPDTKFLVLVYNRRLMLETEARVQALGLDNVTVLNYHTLGTRYYTPECATDQGLKRVVEDDMTLIEGMVLPTFSVLIMDEQQDMTPILKRFVDKVIRDNGFIRNGTTQLRIVVLGDRRQEIYGFNNADARFLSMAAHDQVFGYVNKHGWTLADQTTSNRVTQPNVDFINQQLLKLPPRSAMRAVKNKDKDGLPFARPRYVICNPNEDLLAEVLRLLNIPHLLPTDIIILAPSVRGLSPAIFIANDLALHGIPVFRSNSDVSDIAPEVAHGKVLICTYHQAKGIERKSAIVLGCDQSYYTYYDTSSRAPTAVSNAQYVATTRALEHLVLIHDHKHDSLPFVDLDAVRQTCDVVGIRPLETVIPSTKKRMKTFNVTALCRNLSETLITECLRRLNIYMLAEPAYGVDPPPTEIATTSGLLEDVSSVTGTAVPAIFQWRTKRGLSVFSNPLKLLKPAKRKSKSRDPLRELPEVFYQELARIQAAYGTRLLNTGDILYLSNLEMAAKDKDITKLLAIPLDGYKWLSEAHCKDMYYTLNGLPVPANISGRGIDFERIMHRKFTNSDGSTSPDSESAFILSGAMDICRSGAQNRTVWEIKYTQTLAPEHLLQVALYMLLLGEDTAGYLVSARTGQTVQVLPKTPKSISQILQLLVDAKSGRKQEKLLSAYSDDEFLAECGRGFENLVGKCALPAWFAAKPTRSKFSDSNRRPTKNKKELV